MPSSRPARCPEHSQRCWRATAGLGEAQARCRPARPPRRPRVGRARLAAIAVQPPIGRLTSGTAMPPLSKGGDTTSPQMPADLQVRLLTEAPCRVGGHGQGTTGGQQRSQPALTPQTPQQLSRLQPCNLRGWLPASLVLYRRPSTSDGPATAWRARGRAESVVPLGYEAVGHGPTRLGKPVGCWPYQGPPVPRRPIPSHRSPPLRRRLVTTAVTM